jgi:Putative addiction module component
MNLAHDTSAIFSAALALPRDKRAELLRELIISMEPDEPISPEYDRLLREELQRRWAAFESGEMQAVDWREALLEIRQELQARRTA